ncbi:MAG TPA: hypothetical protein PK440_12655, partial [Candidatus Accumulibacter phosphatis]|nr:hypothetical protein [Candidatus Accumulibacter phosphatis]
MSSDRHAVGATADLQEVAAAIGVEVGVENNIGRIAFARSGAAGWRGDDDAGGDKLGFAACRVFRGREGGGGQ